MTVKVHFKLRQALSETVLGSSLAGDGLLVRLRSASIAMLATVAAIGLGLVAFASQIGWPEVFSGPIPPGPRPGVVRNDPIVPRGERVARAVRVLPAAARGNRSPARMVSEPGGAEPVDGLAPSRQAGSSPADSPAPGAPAPTHATPPPADTAAPETVPVNAPARPGGPPAEAPEPSPPAASPSSSPGKSGESHGKSGESHGKSGESHGHAPEAPPGQSSGGGPPSWAANGDHGKPDGAGH